MFKDICTALNWVPISLSPNVNNQTLLKKNDKQLLINEIIQCRRLGHFEISLKLAQSGLDYFPDDLALLDNSARACQKLNKYSEAIDIWKKILESRKSAPNFKKLALSSLLKDNTAFTEFVISNARTSTPISPVLKKLLDLSIQKRKSGDYADSFEFIEHAWTHSFLHPSLIDNFARLQFAEGSIFRSLYCFNLLKEYTENDIFKSAASKFIEQNQLRYLSQIHDEIQKICNEFDQALPKPFNDLQSLLDFISLRRELGKETLPNLKLSSFNVALFRYIKTKNIISTSAHEMYFDACLNLNYISEAEKFLQQNQHNFNISCIPNSLERLDHLKRACFPSYVGAINNYLTQLSNEEETSDCKLDIEDVNTFSCLEKKCIDLMKRLTTTNPSLNLKIFQQFEKAEFLSPMMYKLSGMSYAILGRQDEAITNFHKYISFIDGAICVLDLSLPTSRELKLVIVDHLKKDIYRHIDQKDYLAASNILVEFLINRSFYMILKNPNLISLTFDYKSFMNSTKDPVKTELVGMYSDINFYDNFINASESLLEQHCQSNCSSN